MKKRSNLGSPTWSGKTNDENVVLSGLKLINEFLKSCHVGKYMRHSHAFYEDRFAVFIFAFYFLNNSLACHGWRRSLLFLRQNKTWPLLEIHTWSKKSKKKKSKGHLDMHMRVVVIFSFHCCCCFGLRFVSFFLSGFWILFSSSRLIQVLHPCSWCSSFPESLLRG